jgi:hypothetical protein
MGRRHGPLWVPPARSRPSCGGPRLGKHVYRTEPALDLNDGLNMKQEGLFSLDVIRMGCLVSIVLPLCLMVPTY